MTADGSDGQSALQKSLPSFYYTSPQIFEREKELIFAREWFCAGREEELPAPGNHTVLEVAGESILAVRTATGELRAHYNVCRHRGARLCTKPQDPTWNVNLAGGLTSSNVIRCPYHQWTYNLEGQLIGAPFLNDGESFRREDFSLYPVGVETWGGFLFLNLNPREASEKRHTVRAQLGPAVERIARYPLERLQTGHCITYHVAANWKILMENYNECYHCGGVHPELCEIVPDFKRAGGSSLDWESGIPHREGAYTFTKSGTTNRAPFPGLSDEEKVRHKGELCFPNLMVSLACDHVAAFLLWPMVPDRTRVECRFLFHPEQMAKPTFDPMDAVKFWDLVNRQDWAICERVQQGISSRVHKFGYYAPMEDPSLDIRNYVSERLGPVQQ
jgi:Rieske 2Fe-2S family protein